MNESISIVIRDAGENRKASVTLPDNLTVEQLLSATQQRWNLDANRDYALRLDRTGEQLDPSATLRDAGIQNNDVIVLIENFEGGQQ
ncbi:MAG: EsaB/YukD family protein [Prochloraceae cyanobacterium]|nr:EsaB/YukD family protein [Prochloraceae cyanobacterium]